MSNSLRETGRPTRSHALTTIIDRWVASLERRANAWEGAETDEVSVALAAPPAQPPATSTSLPLQWDGHRLKHAGSLLPSSLPSGMRDDCLRLAGDPHPGRALWRALQLFGAPFDAINIHRSGGPTFSWGTWRFDAATTADIMAGAAEGSSGDGEAASPLPAELAPLRGDEAALAQLSTTPRALAALAAAARDPLVQRRQIDTIVQRSLRPLAHDRFTEAELVVLLVVDQRAGLGTARELVAQVTSTGNGSGADDVRTPASWVGIAARHLANAGHPFSRRDWSRISALTHTRR